MLEELLNKSAHEAKVNKTGARALIRTLKKLDFMDDSLIGLGK